MINEEFVEALTNGLPPIWGMDIDRLVMLLINQNTIREVVLFPTLRNNK